MAAKTFRGAEFLVTAAGKDDVFTPEDFTPDQKQIADTAEQFARTEAAPAEARLEKHDAAFAAALMRKAGDAGLLMIDAPEEYGGLALDKATSMLAAEKIASSGAFSVSYAAHTGIGTLPLVYYGTAAQKARYLPRLVSGEWAAAYCLTEPDAGSDAMGGKASATLSPDGKHWLLDGAKQFITNGSFASLFTVFAKVDRKHLTAFLVERSFPGVTIGPEEKKLGIKGSSTTSVILEGAQVPVENVLGEIGKGHKIAFNVLNVGRFKLGAAAIGAAKQAFATGAAYANARRQFGQPIGRFGAIREKLADMAAAIYGAESLVYRLAGLLDARLAPLDRAAPGHYEAVQQGIEEHAIECAIAKVLCSDALALVVDEVLQIHGGYGFIQEYAAEKYYRDERINRIFEGTNEINRILVAGAILRRAAKGDFPLEREAARALDALRSPPPPPAPGPFAAEREALVGAKRLFLLLAGATARRFGERVKDEQEVLLALADVAIQILAAESAALRAERGASTLPAAAADLAAAAAKVQTFAAVETIASAARRAAFYVGEGAADLLPAVARLASYDATGLLEAKRRLADAALERERVPF